MKLLREVQTTELRLTLLEEEGVGFYVREIGMTATNEHDYIRKFEKQSEANAEINRLAELLQDNGARIICDTYYVGARKPEL